MDIIPLWGLFLGTCLLSCVALDAGFRLGRWRHAHQADEKETPVNAMVGSILGLLAFLVAFTFSLAATRFETRRQAVLDEANAIGTTYLRCRLLPEPQRTEITGLLREYVDVRVTGGPEGKEADAIAKSESIHAKAWSQAIEASRSQESNAVMTGLFIQSLNQVIDIHAIRIQAGSRGRIPMSIWVGLLTLAMLAMTSVGYQSGVSATRRSPAMLAMVLAFAGVLFLIADLDRGNEGYLRVSQQPLLDLQKSLQPGSALSAP